MALSGRTTRAVLIASVGALMTISAPFTASAAMPSGAAHSQLGAAIANEADDLRSFYEARDYAPLWLSSDGRATPAALRLLDRLDSASFDALDERTVKRLRTKAVRRDLERARSGKPGAVAQADVELSAMFADYVRAMRAAPRSDMIYESAALAPAVPTRISALESAAEARSLEQYIDQMGWMHPYYAPLREAMEFRQYSPAQRRTIWDNLARVRALPATPAERYVLVDTASARLSMFEDGREVDSMKVVVGRPDSQTPAMAGFIRFATVNPYWNVPPDLVQRTIAKGVLSGGTKYLKRNGYEVLASYDPDAPLLNPAKVDWEAVAQGAPGPYVRQKPGGGNFMGKVKYEFPNPQGIYLHDTPERALLKRDERQLSNGCVRLEDADRLGRWLLGTQVSKIPAGKERKLDLPTLVPVYITYLTAVPSENGIAFRSDVYGRDTAPRMAALAP